MSGMDQMLAGFFGTGGNEPAPTAEDAEKVAQAEFFAKTAAAHGIDLEKLNPAQIEWLWTRTFSKEAGTKVAEFPPGFGGKKEKGKEGEPPEHDEKKEREDKARKEHEEKKASAERFEQATYFGKTAAHAYVAEMKNIIAAGGAAFMKEASKGAPTVKTAAAQPEAPAAAAPTTAKQASAPGAFEMEAAELALAKVASAEFDREVAVQRLNAVLLLGLNDSEKVASLSSYEDALERRALEYAAAAGYPVEWAK